MWTLEESRSIAARAANAARTLLSATLIFALQPHRAGTAALQATPQASPVAVECAGPAIVPAPVGAPADVSSGAASPVPEASSTVDAQTEQAIETTVRTLAACISEGNARGVTGLVSERFLGDAYAGGERLSKDDYLELAVTAPVVTLAITSISNFTMTGPDTVTAHVESIQGNQLRDETWTFLFRRTRQQIGSPVATPQAASGRWLAHGLRSLEVAPPANATVVKATLDEYSITFSSSQLAGPNVAINAVNAGQEDHELLILRLRAGATVESLIRPTSESFPATIDVVAQITVPVGQSRDLVLVDLRPGSYTAVCLFPDPSGIPHLALGEQATFTVK